MARRAVTDDAANGSAGGDRPPERILVIRHGALGDIVLSFEGFAAIRAAHPAAELVLLTRAPFAGFARSMPWFDQVWTDPAPRTWQVAAWFRLRRQVAEAGFCRVYDLQNSDRTDLLFRILGARRPWWTGRQRRAAVVRPPRAAAPGPHARDWLATHLAAAGLGRLPEPALEWLDADIAEYGLGTPYALLVPGGSAHRPEKRWPADRFAALAGHLLARGVTPVLVGTSAEREAIDLIKAACPGCRDLGGMTDLHQLAGLGRAATVAVGNDTGPMHLLARVGCPSLVLFSAASDPDRSRPMGRSVAVLRRDRLDAMPVEAVVQALPDSVGDLHSA